jgi:serine/threonine protein kinase
MVNFSSLSTIKRLASGKSAARAPVFMGRFELRRRLGQGAQSTVWLAFDPRLEREVAIKLMKVVHGSDTAALAQWLGEARSVSRLTHPHIVPLFEADVQDQQPYLVFEYVPGQTLAALLAQQGAMPAREAVALMMDVLDALVAAHAAGVVHRDLKPSNVMIDAAGRARVMDFGIAARMCDANATDGMAPFAGGTPAYMSPEAAQGAQATALMDIFSAGLMLAEMLAGKPLVADRDAYRAIYRINHEKLVLPDTLKPDVDDALRAIVLRALAHEPLQRHPGAQVFRDELAHWSGVATQAEAVQVTRAPGKKSSGTLEFLLLRMRHKTDFPAMSDAVVRIQGMALSETESVNSVTNEILKDVALTNKLLRLVNSAHYAQGSSISTVSRAVSLVGFNGIRNMALSLVLLEHMQDKAHAGVLKEEFLRSLLAGSIASEICSNFRENEEAFIGAMFHNLGRLLTEYYFPEEARSVRSLMASTRQPMSEASASTSVLGLSFEALGIGVAKVWGLPEGIQRCLLKPLGEPPARVPTAASEQMRWRVLAANEMADVLLCSDSDSAEVGVRLAEVSEHYVRTLGLSPLQMETASVVARKKLVEMVLAMEITVRPGSAVAKLLKTAQAEVDADLASDQEPPDGLANLELHATQSIVPQTGAVATPDAQQASQILVSGIQDITNAMVEDFNLSDVLRMILETMFRAMNLQRIIFCLRDPKTDALSGRFGLGQQVERAVKVFNVPLKTSLPDLFTAVCIKGVDTLISDATDANLAKRLPAWYCSVVNAPTFLLLPINIKGRALGLIYADKAEPGGLALDEKELALLRTLRNQAVMAFKQSS